jgi:hypothetical protein
MKLLKNISLILILFLSNINFAQESNDPIVLFNGYKYMIINDLDYGAKGNDIYGIRSELFKHLTDRGLKIIDGSNPLIFPSDLKFNNCLGLKVNIYHRDWDINIEFINCKNKIIKNINGNKSTLEDALKEVIRKIDNIYYTFEENLTPKIDYPKIENVNKNETELKAYFDTTKLDPIEGIYKTYKSNGLNLKLAIVKFENEYKAITLEPEASHWNIGDVKIIFENTAVDGVFTAKWFMKDKSFQEIFANLEGGLISLDLDNNKESDEKITINFLKLYPKK